MSLTIEAIYEDGVLKPVRPLPLDNHEHVQVIVQTEKSWAQRTAGMIPWTGDMETLEKFALDPELDPLEGP